MGKERRIEGLKTRGMEDCGGRGAVKRGSRHRREEERDFGRGCEERREGCSQGVFDSAVKGSHQGL